MANKVPVEAYPVPDDNRTSASNPEHGVLPSHETAVAQPYHGEIPQSYAVTTSPQPSSVQGVTPVIIVQESPRVLIRQEDYCCLAWFSCLCCCCPIGLVAIFYSHQAQRAFAMQDFEAAHHASETAKRASILAILCGIVIVAINVVNGSTAEK